MTPFEHWLARRVERRLLGEEYVPDHRELNLLEPGDRIFFCGWCGDAGEGTVVGFLFNRVRRARVDPHSWGFRSDDGLIVQRDFAVGETVLYPFYKSNSRDEVEVQKPKNRR